MKIVNDTLSRHALVLALAFTLAPVHAQQPQPLNPPLKNWAAPLYWALTPAEGDTRCRLTRPSQPRSPPQRSRRIVLFDSVVE